MSKKLELRGVDAEGTLRIIYIEDRDIELWGCKVYRGKFNMKKYKTIFNVNEIVWSHEPSQKDKNFLLRMLNLLPFI